MTAPSKAQQEQEAANRKTAGLEPGVTTADALDVVEDSGPVDIVHGRPEPHAPRQDDPPPPPTRGQFDPKRADIVARFRTDRAAKVNDETDEISDFVRDGGMPADFREAAGELPAPPADEADTGEPAAAAPEPAAREPAAPAALPPKIKVKVHGQERELTLEEVTAEAQKSLAAGDILGEAKALRDEMRQMRAQPATAPHPGQSGDHTGQNGRQPPATELAPDQPGNPQHPEGLSKLIESIQFGDPAEAQTLLENTISERVEQAVAPQVEKTLQSQRLRDEGARTARVLKDFEAQNPELASDQMARAAIERNVHDLQLDDLRQLGIDPAQLQTQHGGPATPADIALAHRWYRANGYGVRAPDAILEKAKDNFLAWKGTAKPQEPSPAVPGAQPRIVVDRQQRREAIPQQPSRTAAPRQAPRQPAAPRRDGSSVVNDMRNRRNAPRGRVGVSD